MARLESDRDIQEQQERVDDMTHRPKEPIRVLDEVHGVLLWRSIQDFYEVH